MSPYLKVINYRKNNPLAFKVLFSVLLFSSCATLVATAWQLYTNFKKDKLYIEKRISQIKEGYGQSLSLSVWDLDNKQIYTLLGGIIELPDIQFLEIRDTKDGIVATMGIPQKQRTIQRKYPLEFTDSQGKVHHLGQFTIIASMEGVFQRFRESILLIFISQMIKTFFVSGFILLVIRHFITRHLSAIAQYMGQEKLGYLEKPIQLNRKTNSKKDELEQVVNAINRMRQGLIRYIKQRDHTQKMLIHSEKMHSVGMLATGVAHEINNPANSVINLAQIIMNENRKESSEHDIARRITVEGNRIARIVGSLLSFSRDPEEKKFAVPVKDIFSETLDLTEAQICKQGTTLICDIPETLPLIRVNPQQIQQVFLNIINNAQFALNKKYPLFHEKKILKIKCRQHAIEQNLYIRTVFTDHGTGISRLILEEVTNPFFTTKPPGIGTGLGLSISCGIIENHHGFFQIKSRENKYTKVIVDLPISGHGNGKTIS